MDAVGRLFQSKYFMIALGGVVMVVVAIIMKRGRLPEEHPSVVERLLWFVGILATASAILIGIFRSDVIDVPEKDKKEIGEYSREGSGCSKPKKDMKDFSNP